MSAPLILICTCHNTLTGTLPKRAVEEGIAARHPRARIEFAPSLCRGSDLDDLAGFIERERPASVLVAACSHFAKGRAVLDGLTARGCAIPSALVDVREGCAFIHTGDPGAAAKAVDLIGMGLAGLALGEQRTRPRPRIGAERRVLVVGAGPAGMAAAGILARLGLPVTLADRLGRMGGLINQIGRLFPRNVTGPDFLAPLLREAAHPAIDFLPKTTVTRIEGDPGRFEARLSRDGRDTAITAGAVILACGALPVLPENRFRSGELSGVISQLELETRLGKFEAEGTAPPEVSNAVFIQCVAARDDARPYCSTVCCPTALKNGLRLKSLSRDIAVTVLHRGIMAPGRALEELYRQAMAAGVRFVAYSPDEPPEVLGDVRAGSVELTDALSGRRMVLPADLVVLSTPLKPRPETPVLAGGLGVRLDEMGFACGSEPMRPLETPLPGVYLCGSVRWPVYADQAVDQGRAAAAKAAAFMENGGEIIPAALSGTGAATVRTEACGRCGQCVAVCPYGACRREGDGTVSVSDIRCRGCGLCTAVCPSGAARIPGHNVPLRAMLREIAPRTIL
ncbi:MAG: FAD-dependent oxidoreductase [Syntrophobacteraceae bacterium]